MSKAFSAAYISVCVAQSFISVVVEILMGFGGSLITQLHE